MSFFDLNLEFLKCHTPVPFPQEMAYEFRKNHFLSTDRLFSQIRISKMRQTIPRQLQNQNVLLLEPVPLHGLCSTDLSREPAGNRSLPTRRSKQNLSYGDSRSSLPQHLSSLFRKFGDVFSNIGLKAHSSEKSPLPPFNQRGDIVHLPFVKGGGEGFQGPF